MALRLPRFIRRVLALFRWHSSFDRSAAGVTSFGMGSGVSNGDLRFTHAGGLDTYTSFSIMFPADRSSVVLLCNFNNNDSNGLFNFVMGIRSIMLGH